MGFLPWVTLVLLMLSTLAWVQTEHVLEQTYITSLDNRSSFSQFDIKLKPVSERSQLAYEAMLSESTAKNDAQNRMLGKNSSLSSGEKKPLARKRLKQYQEKNENISDEIVPQDDSSLPRQLNRGRGHFFHQRPELKLTYRLHFNELFAGESDGSQRKKIERLIFSRLLQRTYKGLLTVSESVASGTNEIQFYDQFIDRILQEVSQVKEQFSIKELSRLANLELDEATNSYILYRMLCGGSISTSQTNYQFPALVRLISLKNRPTILSLYLAPKSILEAITDSPQATVSIMKERKEIYSKLRKIEASRLTKEERDQYQEEFRTRVTQYISQEIDPQYLDFGISKTSPPNE